MYVDHKGFSIAKIKQKWGASKNKKVTCLEQTLRHADLIAIFYIVMSYD